jgi:hypothetical protein
MPAPCVQHAKSSRGWPTETALCSSWTAKDGHILNTTCAVAIVPDTAQAVRHLARQRPRKLQHNLVRHHESQKVQLMLVAWLLACLHEFKALVAIGQHAGCLAHGIHHAEVHHGCSRHARLHTTPAHATRTSVMRSRASNSLLAAGPWMQSTPSGHTPQATPQLSTDKT